MSDSLESEPSNAPTKKQHVLDKEDELLSQIIKLAARNIGQD